MERPADLAGLVFLIETIGFFERLRIDRDHRVELAVVERDALQILLDHVPRAGSTIEHRLLHLGNRRLDDAEGGRRRGSAGGVACRGSDREKDDAGQEIFHGRNNSRFSKTPRPQRPQKANICVYFTTRPRPAGCVMSVNCDSL
jgi:hypothetical protein